MNFPMMFHKTISFKNNPEKYSPGIDQLRRAEFCGKCHKNIHPLTKHVINGSLLEWQESQATNDFKSWVEDCF